MKTIKINNNGQDLILEYNRDSIIKMDEMGFDLEGIEKASVKQILILFRGAFIKNHPSISQKVIDDIYYGIDDKQTFISKLAEMFVEAFSSLFDSPKDETKKVNWEANF